MYTVTFLTLIFGVETVSYTKLYEMTIVFQNPNQKKLNKYQNSHIISAIFIYLMDSKKHI
jgi:hypothetical protein